MNRFSVPLILVVLAGVATSPSTSRAGELRTGDRVRVHATGGDGSFAMTEGTIVSADGESIVMRTKRRSGDVRNHDVSPYDTATIPLSDITGVDRWVRTENKTFGGAAIGTAVGLTVGYFAWKADESNNSSDALVQVHESAALPMVFFGVIGAALGGLAGHMATSDVWIQDPSFKMDITSTAPLTGAPALSLNFDF